MIPQHLTLRNFLSYQAATLDFRGLHTACVCGANGAGKSSLLEAISWALWGESRVASEDDIIHISASEAQVEFVFTIRQQTYRVLRGRQRGQGVNLEFQVMHDRQFRSLTAKNVRSTQQLILDHLKLDYDTFINSAYLRQGRADEFMLKRPAERKQILADLLKLTRYDELAEQAKDKSRQFKGQVELLERNLAHVLAQLEQGSAIAAERQSVEASVETMQAARSTAMEQMTQLQARQHQRQHWQQQLSWQQQQQRNLNQDCQRLQKELAQIDQQRQSLEELLEQQGPILAGYRQWRSLCAQEEAFSAKFQAHQAAIAHRQHYQQQQAEKLRRLQTTLQQQQAQESAIAEQLQEIQKILTKEADVKAGVDQLRQARAQLAQLDQLQMQAVPLLQRRQQVQQRLERIATRLSARLEELRLSARQLESAQQKQPSLQKAAVDVAVRIDALEKLRDYQDQVRDKGLERRAFMERLQAQQRTFEAQVAELDHKIRLLHIEHAEPIEPAPLRVGEADIETEFAQMVTKLKQQEFPPCPLCDRPLDETHWSLVMQKHQQQKEEVLAQLWVVREQLTVSEREIQVLRQEYTEIDQKLKQYGQTLERRGQLQEQLQTSAQVQQKLAQMNREIAKIEHQMQASEFEPDLQQELQILDQSLQQFNYDERDHALARGAVDRWRWSEIKFAEIRQAKRRQTYMLKRQPELQTQIAELEQRIQHLEAATHHGLAESDRRLSEIGYNLHQHDQIRTALRQAQTWQLRQQELQTAQQQFPQVQQRLQELSQTLRDRIQALHAATHRCQEIVQYLEKAPDLTPQIKALEQQLQQQRQQLDEQIARLGRLQQQQQQLELMNAQQASLSQELLYARQQTRVYQELAIAFGKNGIQALMIENILPQLETTTNQILARLTANQLQVQFVTQRIRNKATAKAMETLDILIADNHGTRPYETYSGGEAFRVNFAIRLALARLLSQQSGTALQILIVDEGFGNQDQEGCDRLIAAINAIAQEFACILIITHMPYFREAFQARIEITKTQAGSQITCL
jgi:exonuclease SbcC